MLGSMLILRIQVHFRHSSAIHSGSGFARSLKHPYIAPVRGRSARRKHANCYKHYG